MNCAGTENLTFYEVHTKPFKQEIHNRSAVLAIESRFIAKHLLLILYRRDGSKTFAPSIRTLAYSVDTAIAMVLP